MAGTGSTTITAAISPAGNPLYEGIDMIVFVFTDRTLQQHLQSQVSKSGELLVLNENASFKISGNQNQDKRGVFEDRFISTESSHGTGSRNLSGKEY